VEKLPAFCETNWFKERRFVGIMKNRNGFSDDEEDDDGELERKVGKRISVAQNVVLAFHFEHC
jgi:hypothetical protein